MLGSAQLSSILDSLDQLVGDCFYFLRILIASAIAGLISLLIESDVLGPAEWTDDECEERESRPVRSGSIGLNY